MIQNHAETMVVADAVSGLADGVLTSRVSDEIGESKLVLEELVSAKKHSLSVEVKFAFSSYSVFLLCKITGFLFCTLLSCLSCVYNSQMQYAI